MLRVAAALIATLVVLLNCGMSPAGAHQRSEGLVTAAPPPGPAVPDGFEVRPAASDQDLPWPIALVIAVAATIVARGRSRKVVVAALVVVLLVFAVESAQHSVHHVFDDQPVACPTALMAAHLNGALVETLTLEIPALLVDARIAPPDSRVSPLSPLDPKHGRAPPSALV